MKQIYFLFVVLLVVMAACGGKKETSVDAEQLMFQIDSVDHVTGLQRMQVSRIDQHIVSGGKKYNLFIERAPSDSLPSVLLPYMTPAYAPLCIHLDITDNLHL